MSEININKVLDALENETNASIIELTTQKIKQQKNDMLQKLQLPRDKLKTFHKKLQNYRYCSDLKDLQYGYYLRWIRLTNPDKITLTNGGILCEVKFVKKQAIHLLCKNTRNMIFQFKFDECLVFQKLTQQEHVILNVLDYLDK